MRSSETEKVKAWTKVGQYQWVCSHPAFEEDNTCRYCGELKTKLVAQRLKKKGKWMSK